jgi:hypothetical protein
MSRMNFEDPLIYNPIIKTGLKYGVTKLGDADATIDADMGPVITVTGTASRNMTLPPVTADMKGLTLIFASAAAFTIVVKNAAAAIICTVPANGVMTVTCTGDVPAAAGWIGG